MLWYKAWLETRWRFLIGLALLVIMAVGTVFDYLAVQKLMPLAGLVDYSGELGRRLKEAVDLERTYRGFVWLQWFRQNLSQAGTLLAVILGSGSALSSTAGGVLFTLSMPASRREVLRVRSMLGLAEWGALAFVPSLVIPLFSPAVGQSYSVVDALVHGLCVFVAGAVCFSLASWLSTLFADLWRPVLLACGIVIVLGIAETAAGDAGRLGLFHVMSGDSYFRTGQLPWVGLVVSVAASAALLMGAARNLDSREY